MTVSSTIIKTAPYACDAATVQFAFTWKVWETSEVKVILRLASDGTETELVEGTAAGTYSVTLSNDTPSAGYITTVTTYSALYEIVILANFPYTQEVDYGEGDKFPAKSHEEALDRGVRLSQQFTEKFGRALLFPETTTLEDIELPEINAARADFYLKINNVGSAIEWANLVAYGDLVAHDALGLGSVHTALIGGLETNTGTDTAGLAMVAQNAEVAEGNEQTKVVTPFGLASVLQYGTIQVPAGSLRPAVANAGTQDTQEYTVSSAANNEATTTRDYVEFGDLDQSGDESVAYDTTLILPETWDQAILKAKLSFMAGYDEFISSGSEIAIGLQTKAYNSGSAINVNWSTPPVYITAMSNNSATNVEWDTGPSANIASAVDGSLNRLDVRFTRKNSDDNNATCPVWLTQALFQYRQDNVASGW